MKRRIISNLAPFLCLIFLSVQSVFSDTGRPLVTATSPDGRVEASLFVRPAQPTLSDTVILEWVVTADSMLQVKLPEFGTTLGDLTILDIDQQIQNVGSEKETTRLILKATPTKSGSTPIWPTTISYTDRRRDLREKSYTLELPGAELNISGVAPSDASLDGIPGTGPLLDISTRNYALAVLLALAVIALFLYVIVRRRKNLDPDGPQRKSALELALERLNELAERRLHESDVKAFTMELTGIVRWYIEQQTPIRAPERTTEEFLRELTRHSRKLSGLSPEMSDRLKLFLEAADMVKFAKFTPSQEEIMKSFQRASEFINAFTPVGESDLNEIKQ